MNEFAPRYNKRQRVCQILLTLSWGLPLLAAVQWLGFPWLKAHLEVAHCYRYEFAGLAWHGHEIAVYLLLVGLPLVFALLLWWLAGRRAVKVIRLEQDPLPGERTLKPQHYVYGWRAKAKGIFVWLILIAVIAIAVNGYFSAGQVLAEYQTEALSVCAQ